MKIDWMRRLTECLHISKPKSSYHIERSLVETEIISVLLKTIHTGVTDYVVHVNKVNNVPYKFTGWYLEDFARLRYAVEHQLYKRADEGYQLGNSKLAGGKVGIYNITKDKASMPLVRYKLQIPLLGEILVDLESVCHNEIVPANKRKFLLFKKLVEINDTSLVHARIVVHISRIDTVCIDVDNLCICYLDKKDVASYGWASIENRRK